MCVCEIALIFRAAAAKTNLCGAPESTIAGTRNRAGSKPLRRRPQFTKSEHTYHMCVFLHTRRAERAGALMGSTEHTRCPSPPRNSRLHRIFYSERVYRVRPRIFADVDLWSCPAAAAAAAAARECGHQYCADAAGVDGASTVERTNKIPRTDRTKKNTGPARAHSTDITGALLMHFLLRRAARHCCRWWRLVVRKTCHRTMRDGGGGGFCQPGFNVAGRADFVVQTISCLEWGRRRDFVTRWCIIIINARQP